MEITDPEDQKIVTLARATRTRSNAAEGACVRDTEGRTYAAATVDLPSLQLTALQVAVAMAVSSGVTALEAAAVVTDQDGAVQPDLASVRDAGGTGISVFLADPAGEVTDVVTT